MSQCVPSEKQFSLIRVLVAFAWADGEISNEERNFLKDFFFKFDFTGEDWARIEMYLEEPIQAEEAAALIRDFVNRLHGSGEREELVSMLRGLMKSDGVTLPEEEEFLERCTDIFREVGPASVIMGRVRGLFRKTVLSPARVSQRKEELHDFLNNRVLFKVRRKLEREKLSIEADPDRLAYVSLFAGLLAYVAAVLDGVSEKELTVIKVHLNEISEFDPEAIELIASVVQETASKGLDPFRLTREFYTRSSKVQREALVDCLFDVAGADSDLAHLEVEAVREIAYGLKFSHGEFINAKLRYREREKGVSPKISD